jgi:hypothetical protein
LKKLTFAGGKDRGADVNEDESWEWLQSKRLFNDHMCDNNCNYYLIIAGRRTCE